MTKKIFHSILLVAGAVLLASLFVITGALYEYFGIIQKKQLKDELSLAAVSVEQQGGDFLKRVSPDRYRITWINTEGNVIYDTRTDAESLENHADRTEIKQALKDGYGESIRYSSTLLEKTIYCAQRLTDGSVLRISVSQATIGVLVLGILQPILIVLIAALVLSGMLAKRLSKRIVEPLNSLDLEHPLDNDSYEELSPLLNRINRQHNQITAQMRELKKRTDQFAQITASMNEGLVLLDNRGCILSINPAAIEIFGAEPSCVGQDFLSVDRSHDMSVAIQAALKDGHSEIHARRKGLIYQFDISRIAADGETAGVVILAFDITEKETAEQNRREFTANVSHELKTPLQGIIGSAELIENGMVKPEDMSRFVGHIRLEAQRLVTLIGDIIRLSQLDEGGDMPRENVDLLSVASAVADDLLPSADSQGISIAVEGSPANVYGVKRLLYEIVYNLCDNAIKYNSQGGSVKISTVSEGGFSSVTVSDTGIGIAPEYQNRIFERFFRVDKSHSKSSGGTGLGLSIVKHAVQYHHGKIELTSAPGKGTSITVSFSAIQ
ncbi:MAG: ATP-binding protein [Eubacteriales bacterium]|nr:ATP-binding protein [Eubacteriales bacterium]